MRTSTFGIPIGIVVTSLFLFSASLRADWNEGGPHKMHYPQLPNPNGWDVNCTAPQTIADDLLCAADGPITNFHLWV